MRYPLLTPQRQVFRVAEHAAPEQEQVPPRQHQPIARRVGVVLRELFPESAGPALPGIPRVMAAVMQVAAVGLGLMLMLARIPGIPAWNGIYAEDFSVFLVGALQHPWHLLVPDGGYIEIVPRLIAQFVSYLPLPDAAAAFAIIGALVTAACALFVFHASAGHIHSPVLRAVLGLAVVLLPVAPLEIADSGVGAPWYLLFALFWAVLWRPRSRTGIAVAAVVAFATAASTTMAFVFAPLLVARVIVLPRVREHAVTAGWAAGCLLQVPYVLQNLGGAHSRAGHLASARHVLAFYGHDVVLPALGWHLAWRLQSFAGRNGAMLIVGGLLVVFFAWALVTQRGQPRVFVLTALLIGFALTAVGATLSGWVTLFPVTVSGEHGARYSMLPIFLIDAAAIVAVDSFVRRGRIRLRAGVAVTALVAVLAVGWVTDFRYAGYRSSATNWPPVATAWLHACEHNPNGIIHEPIGGGTTTWIPCTHVRR